MKERGQIVVIALFFSIGLTLAVFTVANLGIMAAERVKLQNTADAAAYSAATLQARYLNLAAYLNRSMVANYNSMAFNMALYSTVDSFDHGGAQIVGMLYVLANLIPAIGWGVAEVGKGIDSGFHRPMHSFNRELLQLFDPDRGKNLNKNLEKYNFDILSIYHGLLYIAAQGIRASVADAIARRSDPDVDVKTSLGVAVETANYQTLHDTVDYNQSSAKRSNVALKKLSEMFDSMMGKGDHREVPLLLGAVSEASLDRFAAGRTRDGDEDTLKNFNTSNIIKGSGAVNALIKAYIFLMKSKCHVKFVEWCAKHCWRHHRWSCDGHMDAYVGAKQRWGQEDKIFEEHVPVINSGGIREVSGFGGHWDIKIRKDHTSWEHIGIPGLGGGGDDGDGENNGVFDFNYSSGTAENDIASMKNNHSSGARGRQCSSYPWGPIGKYLGTICGAPITKSPCNQGKVNACLSQTGFQFMTNRKESTDTHWDGNFSSTATAGVNPEYDPGSFAQTQVKYRRDGHFPSGSKLAKGVPNYKFENPLEQTGFTNYIGKKTGHDRRSAHNTRKQKSFEGPSVVVAASKPAVRVAMLRIAGITNPYSLVALARAQIYYKNNPHRKKEVASSFNPYWAARLAPLHSENLTKYQNSLLPFVASQGISISPNH